MRAGRSVQLYVHTICIFNNNVKFLNTSHVDWKNKHVLNDLKGSSFFYFSILITSMTKTRSHPLDYMDRLQVNVNSNKPKKIIRHEQHFVFAGHDLGLNIFCVFYMLKIFLIFCCWKSLINNSIYTFLTFSCFTVCPVPLNIVGLPFSEISLS